MEFGRKTIRNTIDMMFIANSNHNLQILSAIKHLSFTVNAWTSPNMKAFMAITAHGITPEWKMLDVLIGMPAVEGQHSGVNFADLLVYTLDKLELSDKHISITADNASSNSSLAKHLEYRLGGIFKLTQLLGCMAHVINLSAHDWIRVFGTDTRVVNENEDEITLGKMDLANLVDQPDGQDINLHTVVSRIHGLATYVQGSPQSPNQDHSSGPRMLILDVRTRWNSTYDMLNCDLKLRKVCSTCCGSESRGEVARFSLLDEWDKVAQMVSFLEPLNNVTKILCCSKFSTLSMGLPIYISLITNIYDIQTKYNTFQLIPGRADD
ncbi:uncharacterized protein VP01_3451g4 [Puccinia sorghi]|uniref:DUF659 domain-containing protein n=1 Tax=Puccinia sorghi TaxID=27349 RepID=A0A0L6UY23_9BASI|nr:uncharacterized protein VP01_3451g4 [Puccinia sorghi]